MNTHEEIVEIIESFFQFNIQYHYYRYYLLRQLKLFKVAEIRPVLKV